MLRFLTTIVASLLCQEAVARDPLDKAAADLNDRIQTLKSRVDAALAAERDKATGEKEARLQERIERLESTVAGLDNENRERAIAADQLAQNFARQRADYEAKIKDLTKQLDDLRPLSTVGEAATAEAAAARKELHDANVALVAMTKLATDRLDENGRLKDEIARLKDRVECLKAQIPKAAPPSESAEAKVDEYSRAFRAAHEDAARTTAINSYLSRTFVRRSDGFIVVVSDTDGAYRFGDEHSSEGEEVGSIATIYPTTQAAMTKLQKLRAHFGNDRRLIRVDICDLASKTVVPVPFET